MLVSAATTSLRPALALLQQSGEDAQYQYHLQLPLREECLFTLNWYNAPDPRADYYRYLPSYFTRMADPQ